MIAVEDILQAPNLRELIDELEKAWAEEQKRRHEFWALYQQLLPRFYFKCPAVRFWATTYN